MKNRSKYFLSEFASMKRRFGIFFRSLAIICNGFMPHDILRRNFNAMEFTKKGISLTQTLDQVLNCHDFKNAVTLICELNSKYGLFSPDKTYSV